MIRTPVADLEVLPGAEPAGGGAELLGAALEVGQGVGVLDLVAELDQPDPALVEHQRVVVPLVPALEPELAGLLVHDLHAERVRVVVAGFFEVRHPQMDVPQPDDSACLTHPTRSFLFASSLRCSPCRPAAGGPSDDRVRRGSGRRTQTRLSRSPSWSSMTMLVSGTARQLRQIPSTRSSSVSTLVGDRPLVADLAEHELNLADPATAALAADPVAQPGPRQRARAASRRRCASTCTPSGRMRHLGSVNPPRIASSCSHAAVHPDRAEPVELGDHDPARAAAARRPSGRRTARSHPASSALAPRGQRLGQPDQRRGRVAHHGAAGGGVDRPAGPEDAAENAEVDQRVRADGPGRRAMIRAAPALSATESGRRKGSRVARVHHLDGRRRPPPWPRGPGRPWSAPSIRSPIRNAISGSARGWMSSSRCTGSPMRDHHPRRQPAEDRLVDAQRLALDPAGQPQLRADDAARRPAGGARRTATGPCRPSRRAGTGGFG